LVQTVQPKEDNSCIVIGGDRPLHIDGTVGMRRATAHFGHSPYRSFHGLTQIVSLVAIPRDISLRHRQVQLNQIIKLHA
jgi:hypothetical protein